MDEFGLIECTQCGAQLLVHMDGRVEHSGAQVLEGDPPVQNEQDSGSSSESQEMEMAGEDLGEFEATSSTSHVELNSAEDLDAAPAPAFEDELFAEEPPPLTQASAPVLVPSAEELALGSPDLSDIERFGNSAESAAGTGPLRYNLYIGGIDTSDMRRDFREAITDRKMMWDTDQILRSIHNGEVKLAGISAVKAYILVSRLRNMPLSIRWEQYAISQS